MLELRDQLSTPKGYKLLLSPLKVSVSEQMFERENLTVSESKGIIK